MSRFNQHRKPVYYNNINLYERYGIKAVDLELFTIEDFGVRRSVTFTGDTLVNVEDNRFSIKITFIRTKNNEIVKLDDEFLKEMSRLFYSSKKANILEYSLFYYVMPTSGSIEKMNNIGHFSVEFESLSPYSYSGIYCNRVNINKDNSGKVKEISNNGINVVKMDVDIECINDGNLIITNNGNIIKVNNVVAGDIVTIIGDTSEIEADCEIEFNYKALELRYGVNRIKLETDGMFKVEFKFQAEYGLI